MIDYTYFVSEDDGSSSVALFEHLVNLEHVKEPSSSASDSGVGDSAFNVETMSLFSETTVVCIVNIYKYYIYT